ncbi:MAG: M1 family metallopeptidase [Myxococcota bacterium]|nr:M1 family metallopeptidase [Myxococcota bacterium]
MAVAIEPNSSDAFRGSVGIEIEIHRGRRSIELHAADLRVSQARVIVDERTLRGRIVPHPERQTIEVQLSESVPKGRARLELKFAGRLRKDLCGLYGATVGDRRYAFTQLEAADARKFFPCFDEPSMKARWQMTVTTSEANSVISNNPIEHTEKLPGGNKRVRFSRTPKLSSYLVALAVGELTCSRVTRAGKTAIRVWHVPGKQGMTAFSLDCARETLQRLERYFDLPYPYEKLDLVAVPDFEFGAMENAGAVFFRETLLLVDTRTVTLAEKKRAAEVICHELAHMWYGDLVTMAWWDDLWLNEAFATWMAFLIVDEWQPDWKMWHDFHHHRAGALELDALEHTHPIYVKVRTPDEANENFDLITYEKGASVVRMIERYLGPEVFRAGVRTYIRRHAESNTVAADLWNALSEAAGQPIEPIVRAWIEQDGYPVVSVKRKQKTGHSAIELRQERLLEMPPTRAKFAEEVKNARWPVPWVGRVGSDEEGPTTEIRHLLTKRVDTIDAPRADLGFVYGNADESGFFRPLHGADELRDLIEALPVLNPAERMGLIDHQWALVRAGRANVSSLLDLIAATGAETNPDVLVTVKRPLAMLASRFAPDVSRNTERRLRAWVGVYFGAQIDELGFDPAPGEPEATRVRRAAIIDIVGGIGESTRVVDEAQTRCRKYLRQRSSLESNLADAVVSIAASHGDAWLFDAFLDAMHNARTPQEERRFLMGLCDFRDAALIERCIDLVLTDDVPTQDVAFVLVRLFANRSARPPTWDFVRQRWPKLRDRMGSLLAGRVIAATPSLGTRTHRREVARFFKANPVPSGARTLRQALERFDWYEAFKAREGPGLDAYLHGHASASKREDSDTGLA